MFYVYGLIDPRDNQIHYVGITQNSPARRLASHISGGASAKDGWLTALIDVGFLPRIAVLQQAETYSEIFELETWWIKIAEQVGWPITNTNKTNRRIMRDSNGFVIAQPDCDEWQDVAREFEPANLALTDGDAIEQRTEGLQYDSHQRDRRRPRRIPIAAPAPPPAPPPQVTVEARRLHALVVPADDHGAWLLMLPDGRQLVMRPRQLTDSQH